MSVRHRARPPSRRDVLAYGAAALGGLAIGCGSGGSPPPGPPAPDPPDPRFLSLHLCAPNGVFAWWQLLWPHVEVALADNPGIGGLGYHEPAALGTHVLADAATDDREWFASSHAPWIDGAGVPYAGMEVTALMAGRDETHTQFPSTAAIISGKADLLAGAAAIQVQESSALLPVIGVDPIPYGQAPGAPTPTTAPDADGLVQLFSDATGTPGIVAPTMMDLQAFGIAGVMGLPDSVLLPSQRQGLFEWGKMMIVTAKAMALGLSDVSVLAITPGPTSDTTWVDPHDSFDSVDDLRRTGNCAQRIGMILEGFYQYLAAVPDPSAPGRALIDNVVITCHGDTPHDPLQASGWPDATPDGCNWIYVVGKGHLKHGWFGRVHTMPVGMSQTSGFDGATGADVPGRPSEETSQVAGAAIAYAIARGDSARIAPLLDDPAPDFTGLVRD